MIKNAIMFSVYLMYLFGTNACALSSDKLRHSIEKIVLKGSITEKRPDGGRYCFDFAGVVPQDVVEEIDSYGRDLRQEFDIDFVVIVTPSLEGKDTSTFAADIFSRWEIGKSTQGKKGILILIAQREQKVKIEVGYDLEYIYTDLYVAQVEREMLGEFLEQADWKRGFLATIENFMERTYRMQKKGVDVKNVSGKGELEYYSGGAGAKGTFDFGAALKRPLPRTSKELRKYFGAQSTPGLAFQRYMEFCARNMKDYTVDLFNPRTKVFFSYWPTSTGQRRSEAQEWDGLSYEVRQKGKWAAVFHPGDNYMEMATHPVYLVEKTKKGWQMDLDAMARSFIYSGRFVHWANGAVFLPYVQLFMDDYTLLPNMYCLAKRGTNIGTFDIAYLGTGLYPEWEAGIHIYPRTEELSRKTGFKSGDSIVEIDGKKVSKGRVGEQIVSQYLFHNVKVGDRHHLRILRNDRYMDLDVEAQVLPDVFENFKRCFEVPRVWMGVYVSFTNEVEQKHVSTYCMILDVYPNSPADRAGLKQGDIIYAINGKVQDVYPYNLVEFISNKRIGYQVTLGILRNLKERKRITVILEETYHKGYF